MRPELSVEERDLSVHRTMVDLAPFQDATAAGEPPSGDGWAATLGRGQHFEVVGENALEQPRTEAAAVEDHGDTAVADRRTDLAVDVHSP